MSQSTMTCITVLPIVVVPIQNASLSVASMTIMAEREEVIDLETEHVLLPLRMQKRTDVIDP